MRRQLLVDHVRHGLIGRRPVAVAAAEHGVTQSGERILWQAAVQPFDELRGVIRRAPGSAEDQQPALSGSLPTIIVERAELVAAVDLGEVGYACCQFFRRAEVEPCHHQRRVVSWTGPRLRRCRIRGGRHGRTAGEGATILVTRGRDLEAVGLDRQRFFSCIW